MPYTSSRGSVDTIARLRDLLGGGGNKNPGDTQAALLDQLLGASQNPSPDLAGVLPKQSSGGMLSQFFTNAGPALTAGLNKAITDPAQATPVDPLQQFLMSMAGDLNGGTGTGLNQADYEEALKNSAAQIKGAFGAEIGAVKASSANARHQTKRSKKQIKAMYNALGRQYDKAAGKEVAQGQQIANALQGVATNAAGQLKGTSDQLLNEQAALAQGLGVQSALPTVAAVQQNDVAKQIGNIQQTGAREAGGQLENSGAQQRYLVRGGKNALLEGTNRRADLVQQLQAFLQQNMGKIADIQGQRGQALAANASSLAKSFGDANNNAASSQWGREKDLASLMLSLRGQNNSQASSQAKSDSYAQQQSNDTLMKLMQLLNSSATASQDPKKMAEVYKLIQGALQAQAGG